MMGLMIFLIGFSGPVGSYLGIYQGKWALDTFSIAETIHYFFPSETIEVYFDDGITCESIVKETVYQGNIAYLKKTSYPLTAFTYFLTPFGKRKAKERQEYYDTLFEYGNCLIWTGTFVETIPMQETLYKTPFSINLSWSHGLRGRTYILDLDGEGILNDTLTFLADTSRVINIENVNTPYGLIPNTYKIRTYHLIKIHGSYSNYPWRDTVRFFDINWYKDSLWLAKDSVYQAERFWFNIGIWVLITEVKYIARSYLKDVLSAIGEDFAQKIKIIYLEKPLTFNLKEKGEFLLINNSGQVLLKERKEKIFLDNKKYPKGVYYLKIKSNDKKEVFKLIKY